jgi:pilus assembly protein Flp/PilA
VVAVAAHSAVAAATHHQREGGGGGAGNGVSCNWKGNTMELIRHIKAFVREEDGVTAVEYGLIASLVALAILTGASTLGTNLNAMFKAIAGKLVTA